MELRISIPTPLNVPTPATIIPFLNVPTPIESISVKSSYVRVPATVKFSAISTLPLASIAPANVAIPAPFNPLIILPFIFNPFWAVIIPETFKPLVIH